MPVRSKWLFILLGNNATGKTTVQRHLVNLLGGTVYERLPSNQAYEITHARMIRKFRKVFIAGRSYQELRNRPNEYTTVDDYFRRKLDAAGVDVDLAFLASHLDPTEIGEMIRQAQRRFWNVCAIFFENSTSSHAQPNADIAAGLPWNERWFTENPLSDDGAVQEQQLAQAAAEIVQMLIERMKGC
jgi:hypothetical protein